MVKIKINKNLLFEKIDDQLVCFDSDKSIIYYFNNTAKEIFLLIKKNKTKKEIVDIFLKKYQINEKQLVNDIEFFLNELRKKKIILNE